LLTDRDIVKLNTVRAFSKYACLLNHVFVQKSCAFLLKNIVLIIA